MAHEIEFRHHFRRVYSVHVNGELIGNIRRTGVGVNARWGINIPGLNVSVIGRRFHGSNTAEPSRTHFRTIGNARRAVVDHINGRYPNGGDLR